MSRTITVSWAEPTTREGGSPLTPAEILNTEVLIAPTVAGPFVSLAKVAPNATQTITKDVVDGTWVLRFIVTDTLNQKGKNVDQTIVVKSNPPGVVTSIVVTMA